MARVSRHVPSSEVLPRGPWIDVKGFLVGRAGRWLKGVDASLAIVKAGAAATVVIKQSTHHACVTTFRGQMQGCQAGVCFRVNSGPWNYNNLLYFVTYKYFSTDAQ